MSNDTEAHKHRASNSRFDAVGKRSAPSDNTKEDYAKKRKRLGRQAREHYGRENVSWSEFATWFAGRDGMWTPATIRAYSASVMELIEQQPENVRPEDVALIRIGPEPKSRGNSRDGRCRRISPKQFVRFRDEGLRREDADDAFAVAYSYLSICFFPRPVEWQRARVEGNFLVFQAAKTRGDKDRQERKIDLTGVDRETIILLGAFLLDLHRRVALAGSWKSFYDGMASRIRRICERAGLKPFSPYSCRHIGYAEAKKSLGRTLAAAMAGHASTAGCSRYASGRSSLGLARNVIAAARPTQEAVTRVAAASGTATVELKVGTETAGSDEISMPGCIAPRFDEHFRGRDRRPIEACYSSPTPARPSI